MAKTAELPLPLGLALQGGGSHGAFGWGVLERLLEDERIAVRGASGTSAGAVNAYLLAHGWLHGGREGAIRALGDFWRAVAETQTRLTFGLFDRTRLGLPADNPSLDGNPVFLLADTLARFLSPYALPTSREHPLEDVFAEHPAFAGVDSLDLDAVVQAGGPRVWVTATDVVTGEAVLFGGTTIRRRHVFASACLPNMSRAVHEGGRFYWDGGYSANPSLKPLMRTAGIADVLIVQVNPRDRAAEPDTAREIINRINEISFNSSLLWQTRGIERLNDAYMAVTAMLEVIAASPEIDLELRQRLVARTREMLAGRVTARNRLAHEMGRSPLNLLLPEPLAQALGEIDPNAATGLDLTALRLAAIHMIDADAPEDLGIERFDASSKLNASLWFLEQLRELGRRKADQWLDETLPLILASRARGEVLSTFWHETSDRPRQKPRTAAQSRARRPVAPARSARRMATHG